MAKKATKAELAEFFESLECTLDDLTGNIEAVTEQKETLLELVETLKELLGIKDEA